MDIVLRESERLNTTIRSFLDYARRGPLAIAKATTLPRGGATESPFEAQVLAALVVPAAGVAAPVAAEPPPPAIVRYVVVDNVCAWPNLTLLRDGSIAAASRETRPVAQPQDNNFESMVVPFRGRDGRGPMPALAAFDALKTRSSWNQPNTGVTRHAFAR